jgi:hypothetical protein
MKEMNEIKLPKGVESISVTQHDDKIVIEFIPEERKFKAGDKVKIKDGISNKTHERVSPGFTSTMDEFIGKKLTVKEYNSRGWIVFYEDDREYGFSDDWLEPWSDEPKKGDLAIFWDYDDKEYSAIHVYDRKGNSGYYDSSGIPWDNAVKFESKDQFEKVLRGEI